MGPRLKAYLQLCRPANLPTAAADIIAGVSVAGLFGGLNAFEMPLVGSFTFLLLVLASVFLYAGGVVLNDVFDIEIDKVERPERPIPSGRVTLQKARLFGYVLLLIGTGFAFLVNTDCGVISILLALAILSYDKFAKHHAFFGPLNMGICRGLNLFMGMSLMNVGSYWPYVFIPVIFIFAVTMISRGEVHGKNKGNILLAGLLYLVVIFEVFYLHQVYANGDLWYMLFLALFAFMVFNPLIRAYHNNKPGNIKKAVKAGVLSIILLDAAIAVAHSNIFIGLIILLLLPLAIYLAKQFAVT
ncbi:UbiA-like protein EboC [Flagellimonas crocea]|uniref:UbiA-like protein EboC n=1 Tax=Flagellimonas crocea TaxID=3067311 RepID=UPI00296E9B6E|nr:UbiA-like protein EboC [Muricauda sp. DH64]